MESSQIDWSKYKPKAAAVLKEQKQLRPHQEIALEKTVSGLATAERGKLIMACGTGKTFTSLKIAEKIAGKGKRVLFLVPSLSLLSQTLTEWTQESTTPLHSFAVCSDIRQVEFGSKLAQALFYDVFVNGRVDGNDLTLHARTCGLMIKEFLPNLLPDDARHFKGVATGTLESLKKLDAQRTEIVKTLLLPVDDLIKSDA